MPLFYAWPDGGVLTPDIVTNRWFRKSDGNGAGGSQTAYYLVAKRWALRNSDIFPAVRASDDAGAAFLHRDLKVRELSCA